MTDDIVKRIEREVQFWRSHEEDTHLMKEAAETVTRLRAENEKLREYMLTMTAERNRLSDALVFLRAENEKLRAALNGWQKWWELPWEGKRPDFAEIVYRKAAAAIREGERDDE